MMYTTSQAVEELKARSAVDSPTRKLMLIASEAVLGCLGAESSCVAPEAEQTETVVANGEEEDIRQVAECLLKPDCCDSKKVVSPSPVELPFESEQRQALKCLDNATKNAEVLSAETAQSSLEKFAASTAANETAAAAAAATEGRLKAALAAMDDASTEDPVERLKNIISDVPDSAAYANRRFLNGLFFSDESTAETSESSSSREDVDMIKEIAKSVSHKNFEEAAKKVECLMNVSSPLPDLVKTQLANQVAQLVRQCRWACSMCELLDPDFGKSTDLLRGDAAPTNAAESDARRALHALESLAQLIQDRVTPTVMSVYLRHVENGVPLDLPKTREIINGCARSDGLSDDEQKFVSNFFEFAVAKLSSPADITKNLLNESGSGAELPELLLEYVEKVDKQNGVTYPQTPDLVEEDNVADVEDESGVLYAEDGVDGEDVPPLTGGDDTAAAATTDETSQVDEVAVSAA